jgi:hypothetical protein
LHIFEKYSQSSPKLQQWLRGLSFDELAKQAPQTFRGSVLPDSKARQNMGQYSRDEVLDCDSWMVWEQNRAVSKRSVKQLHD